MNSEELKDAHKRAEKDIPLRKGQAFEIILGSICILGLISAASFIIGWKLFQMLFG